MLHISSSYRTRRTLARNSPLFWLCVVVVLAVALASTQQADGFVLQELPLYRSVRVEQRRAFHNAGPRAATDDSGFFGRPVRATKVDFQKMGRLRDAWNRNEALRRLDEQSRLGEFERNWEN